MPININSQDYVKAEIDYYDANSEITVQWNDPDIGINWPIANPELSEKDSKGRLLKDFSKDELPKYENSTT